MKINNPYTFSAEELATIKNNFKTHTDWEKSAFNDIKENIVHHLRQEQDNKCCYCKTELGYDLKAVDIDHIIPKSKYEKFTFHPKNLALACPGCNTSKGKKSITTNKIVQYPRSGRNISIIHAHYDIYSRHIEIHENAIYEGLNAKGCETIKTCKLFRLKAVLSKQRSNKTKESPIRSLVEALRTSTPAEQADLAEELMNILKRPK